MIIFEVTELKQILKSVCERYNINFSSAKNIMQVYKKEGRLEKKVTRVKRHKKKEFRS